MERKICHFSSVHAIDDSRVFYRECISLVKKYDVTLVAIGNYTGKRENVKIIGIPRPSSRIVRYFFTRWIVFYKAILTKACVYHIHDPEMIPFAIILSCFGKRVIYDIHENTYQDILYKTWIPSMFRRILAELYRFNEWVASYFLHFIIVTARPEFLSCFHTRKNHYHIIQNFADTETLRPYFVEDRTQLEGNHLFYSGTIQDVYYNFYRVIEAMVQLKQSGIPVTLHCFGGFGQGPAVYFPIPEIYQSVKDQIVFYGQKDMHEAYRISRKCKVGICLKNQPESILVSHERKFFEYMAIGLPMVCSNATIYSEIVSKNKIGIPVDLENSHMIAAAIGHLLNHAHDLKDFQQNAIHTAKNNYNWKSQELILLNIYNELTQS